MVDMLKVVVIFIIELYIIFLPTRGQFLYEFHVKENSITYKSVLNLRQLLISKNKIESGGGTMDYKIYITKTANPDLFRLDTDQNLRVARLIDREELCPTKTLKKSMKLCGSMNTCCYILEFQVSYKMKDVQTHYLRVYIDDENDNTPIFPQVPTPYYTVEENKAIGFKITLPKAIDSDNQTNGIGRYQLMTPFLIGNSSDFEMGMDTKSSTPILIISSKLDRETNSVYKFNLIAIDGIKGYHQNTGTTEIIIRVRDVNDNRPQFDKHIYMTSIKENTVVNSLFDILITDKDENENGDIYIKLDFLDQHDVSALFTLDITEKRNGKVRAQLRTLSNLDYESFNSNLFEFLIVATDQGRTPLTSTASVRIQIINVNDEKPIISVVREGRIVKNGFDIDEEILANTLLAYIHVQDHDSSTNQLQCHLKSYNNLFAIKETQQKHPTNLYKKYFLRTSVVIDREEISHSLIGSKLILTVECCDYDTQHSLCSNSSIYITINDINDNAPVFSHSKYYGYINENLANTEIKFNPYIQATDKDLSLNSKLMYSLRNLLNRTDAEKFKIYDDSNKIFTNDRLDYEVRNNYTFLIYASDIGYSRRLSSSSTVYVTVKDENDNVPIFDKLHYTFSIKENSKIGHKIGQVHATDRDYLPQNKRIRYRIKTNHQNRGENLISIDENSGEILTSRNIDREQISSITLFVQAANPTLVKGRQLQEAMVVIKVQNVNDVRPRFELNKFSNSRVVISEESLRQGHVCELIPYMVKDDDNDDVGAGFCCRIQLKNDFDGLISLSPESQNMMCINRLPEKQRNIRVTLIAYDSPGNDSLTAEVSFSILIRPDSNYGNSKSKVSPKSHQKRQPYEDHFDIRQIILIIALASLAGLVIVAIIMLVIFGQKKCDFFNPTYESTCSDEDEKINNANNNHHGNNNQNISESVLFDGTKYSTMNKKDQEMMMKLSKYNASTLNIYNALHTPADYRLTSGAAPDCSLLTTNNAQPGTTGMILMSGNSYQSLQMPISSSSTSSCANRVPAASTLTSVPGAATAYGPYFHPQHLTTTDQLETNTSGVEASKSPLIQACDSNSEINMVALDTGSYQPMVPRSNQTSFV